MKRLFFALMLVSLNVISLAAEQGSVTLGWDRDPSFQVTGYKVYYGTQSGVYTYSTDVGFTTEATLTGLIDGQRYFCVVTAYNSAGLESGFSEELTFVHDAGDPAGTTFRIRELTFGPDQTVNFGVEGMTGATVDVYASDDLIVWRLIGSSPVSSGMLTIRDQQAAGAPKRFYKLSAP